MEEKWIDHEKKEIYFLEWLAQASGFSEEQILENMKPENQKWSDKNFIYYSIDEYFDTIDYPEDYLAKIFDWQKSFLKPDYLFWDTIYEKWIKNIKKYRSYKILFTHLKIDVDSFKLNNLVLKEKLKIKSKKLKI